MTQDLLPTIPLVRLGREGLPTLVSRCPDRLATVLRAARRGYTVPVIALGDRLSRHWAQRNGLAEADEIAEVARRVGQPGAWMLNLSYEWACTSAAHVGPDGRPRLLRTLDWGLKALGSAVVVAEIDDPAGSWFNITWPGFVGSVQGMAPGRFAIAINQAPGPLTRFGLPGDWLVARRIAWRSGARPPVMLLRDVFRHCRGFDEARAWLSETAVTLPVIFTIVGTRPDHSAVIERMPNRARVHTPARCVTNHWLNSEFRGRSHSILSSERLAAMRETVPSEVPGFGWVRPPILNERTRLAMDACPADGSMLLEGYEGETPVTGRLSVQPPADLSVSRTAQSG